MNDKNKNIFKIIILILVIVGIITLTIFGLNHKKETLIKDQIDSEKTTSVTDHSRYFSAVQCVEKFLQTVNNNNLNDTIKLLNTEFKEANNISIDNVTSFLPNLSRDRIYTFKANSIQQKRISKNVIEYYLKGQVAGESMDRATIYTDFNVTVVLYEQDKIFSIKIGIGD